MAGLTGPDRALRIRPSATTDPDGPGAIVVRPTETPQALPDDGTSSADPTVLVDGEPVAASLVRRGPDRARLIGPGQAGAAARIVFAGPPVVGRDGVARQEVLVDGWRVEVESEPEARAALRERARRAGEALGHGGPAEIRSVFPGRVVSVAVAVGDAVAVGQPLLVIEAMKMQNELRSPRDGTVARVEVGAGTTVEVGDLLLAIE